MPSSSEAESLAAAIEAAADAEPRMHVLLRPSVAEAADGRETISLYWYDVAESMAAESVIEVADYADAPPASAAQQFIESLFD